MNADIVRPKAHHGRNIKRLREMLGIKQETLASELEITQAAVSSLEQKEEIEDKALEKIAEILKVPVSAIKNMTDETTINYINTFNDSSVVNGGLNYYPTFNPVDKVVELYKEKEKLYERMLKEKNDLLERLLNGQDR